MAREKDRTTTPPQYDVPPPQLPGADYSYTVELVGSIQNQLGKLTEAVDSLKTQSKEHGIELKTIAKDVHAAKVVFGVVGGLILLVCGFIAWLVNTYISTHPAK